MVKYKQGKHPNSLKNLLIWTKEKKNKISITLKGREKFSFRGNNNPMKNIENVKKMVKTRRENGSYIISKETKEKMRDIKLQNPTKYWKGKKLSTEHIKKMRIKASKRLENDRFIPNIGKNEKQILDELEKLYKLKITRQYPIIGYFVDGYIPELNLVIEIDEEKAHCRKQIQKRDIERENEIKQELNCNFLRIKDKWN